MITLELTDGRVIRLNLKNSQREQTLRAAWYSMSDIPKYKDKEYRIIGDSGNEYKLKIGQIKSCTYSPAQFDHSLPEVQTPPSQPKKLFENSMPDSMPGASNELVGLIKRVLEAVAEVFESMPDEQKRNIVVFMEGLRMQGVAFDIADTELMEIASQALVAENPTELMLLIKKYCDRYRSKK